MSVTRLSAQEFIQKMRDAETWSLRYDTGGHEYETMLVLPVKGGTYEDRECFLGPDPIETDITAYREFADAVMEIVDLRLKK